MHKNNRQQWWQHNVLLSISESLFYLLSNMHNIKTFLYYQHVSTLYTLSKNFIAFLLYTFKFIKLTYT